MRRVVQPSEAKETHGAFRDIEQPRQRSHDAIAVAAATAFASLHRPSRQDRAQLDLLIRPHIGELSASSLKNISAVLCNSRHAPVQLLHALAVLPVEISAPLIMCSPLLTDDFLEVVATQQGEAHRKVIEKRAAKRTPAAFTGEDVRRKLVDIARAPARNTASVLPSRNALVAAVCVGHDVEFTSAVSAQGVADISEILLSLAMSKNPAFLATHLADKLSLPFPLVEAIMADPAGSEFATLLKAAGTETATAIAVVLIVGGANMRDSERIRLIFSRYSALAVEDASTMVRAWRSDSGPRMPAAGNGTMQRTDAA